MTLDELKQVAREQIEIGERESARLSAGIKRIDDGGTHWESGHEYRTAMSDVTATTRAALGEQLVNAQKALDGWRKVLELKP